VKTIRITKKMFELGWFQYQPGKVPNLVRRDYVLVRTEGEYYVVEWPPETQGPSLPLPEVK